MQNLHNSLFVAGQITEDLIPSLAESGIKTIINNRPDNEEPGQPNHEVIKKSASAHGIEYFYLPMINGQPMPETIVSDFKAILDNNESPILAHCRSGMRSTFIWALGQVGDGSLSVDEVIQAATQANIPLANYRSVLESAVST